MFKGFFKSAADKPSPEPEKRRLPPAADETWITSQVFTDRQEKDNDNERIYWAARPPSGAEKSWQILSYRYSLDDADLHGFPRVQSSSACETISLVMQYEKKALESDNLSPVSGLQGNYRDAAHRYGAYFDDNGNFVAAEKGSVIAKESTFNRKMLDALYGATDNKSALPVITTWDDFYREIVHKFPLATPTADNFLNKDYSSSLVTRGEGMLKDIKNLETKILDEKIHVSFKQSAITDVVESKLADLPYYDEHAAYNFNVTVLTGLMRAGTQIYREFSTQFSEKNIQLLSEIGNTIGSFLQERFSYPAEDAKKVASLIMQGPDPYANQPLPFEEFLKAAKALPAKKPMSDHGYQRRFS